LPDRPTCGFQEQGDQVLINTRARLDDGGNGWARPAADMTIDPLAVPPILARTRVLGIGAGGQA
jgi:hypothetical protein